MKKAKLQRSLRQYLNNNISREDCIELLNYLNNADIDEVEELIDIRSFDLNEGPEFGEKQSRDLLNRIKSDPRFDNVKIAQIVPEEVSPKFYQSKWIKIAAATLIFFTAGLLFIQYEKNSAKPGTTQANDNSAALIFPGGKRATLTMTNGKVISLNNAANGVLAQTNAGNIIKTKTGQIVYNNSGVSPTAAGLLVYNTLSTPKGGEYQVVLPDGTKVWLNAASSITYPTAFTGNERHVKLTGEAYFEVAKNKAKPFYVSINDVQVKVLGTHFNITAYNDDNDFTATLLEGSVQVSKNHSLSLLKPGQQAVINNGSDHIAVSEANIENAMAWKNGYFIFNDDDIKGIMKKVSRWYDVDVVYQGAEYDQKFGGTFYRSKSITELLQHLELIGKIHFKIKGRRITVMA